MKNQNPETSKESPNSKQGNRNIRRANDQHVEFCDLCLVAQKGEITVLSFLQTNPLEPQPFVVAQIALDPKSRVELQRQLNAPSQKSIV